MQTKIWPYHVTYLSPQSQNEFATLLEKELRGKVIEEVKRAGMYSVMTIPLQTKSIRTDYQLS